MLAPTDLIVCGLHVRSIPYRFRFLPKREPWNRSGRLSPPAPRPCVAVQRSQRFPRTSRSDQSLRATRRFRFSSFFCPFVIFDVGPRRIPPHQASLFVVERLVLDKEPAILTILPPRPLFDLERKAA